jgi:hypothetical protein
VVTGTILRVLLESAYIGDREQEILTTELLRGLEQGGVADRRSGSDNDLYKPVLCMKYMGCGILVSKPDQKRDWRIIGEICKLGLPVATTSKLVRGNTSICKNRVR